MPLVIALFQERLSISKTLLCPVWLGRAALSPCVRQSGAATALCRCAVLASVQEGRNRMHLVREPGHKKPSAFSLFFGESLLRFFNADRDGPNGPKAVVNRAGFGFEAPWPITEVIMSDFEEMFFEEKLDGLTAQVRAESSSLKELRASVAPINGYGSYLPDEIIGRTDLSDGAKVLCHELDKYRNCDPQSERYLQCNPGHFTLQQKCGFRSKRQVEQIVQELVDKDLVEVQPGQKAKYVLSWPTPAEQEQRQREVLEAKREEIRAEAERREKEETERQELAEIKAREERAAQFERYKALYPIEAVIAGDEKAKDWVIEGAYLQDYFDSEGEAKYQRAIELREKPQLDEDAEKLRRQTVRDRFQASEEIQIQLQKAFPK